MQSKTALPSGISVVVPVYNSASTLAELVRRLEPVLSAESIPYELILVNDGSRDASWDAVCQLSAVHPWIRGINLLRNYGQHNAVLCGVRAAQFDTVVTMDDDLQHPPEEIPKLLRRLAEGYDVVYGKPFNLPHSIWRNIASAITKRGFALAVGNRKIGDINAFRAIRTCLRDAFADFRSPNLLFDVLLSWGTVRFDTILVEQRPRMEGKSNYSFLMLINQMLLLLTGYSTAPLRLASLLGLGFTLFGFGVMAYVMVGFFVRGSMPGFTFLASIVSLFSGVQLFTLGIIGEYIARMFNRSLERPTYVVKEMIGQ